MRSVRWGETSFGGDRRGHHMDHLVRTRSKAILTRIDCGEGLGMVRLREHARHQVAPDGGSRRETRMQRPFAYSPTCGSRTKQGSGSRPKNHQVRASVGCRPARSGAGVDATGNSGGVIATRKPRSPPCHRSPTRSSRKHHSEGHRN